MADKIIRAEVTVTKVWPPKGNFFAFNCAELVTDENRYGRVSAPVAVYKKIKEKGVYEIAYHKTDEGYLNFDTLITDLAKSDPPKQVTRASTSSSDALHIFVNGKLTAFIEAGEVKLALTEIVEAIDLLVEAYQRSRLAGNKAQTRDDLNDEIPFP